MAKRGNNSLGRRAYGGKPYDANNSFVKKMATKVTDLMPQRSWISKWFNSSEDNGEANDNESPEEGDGEEEIQPPATKRPRIRMDVTHPPGTFSIRGRDGDATNDNHSRKDRFSHVNETGEDFLEPPVAGPSGVRRFVASTPAVAAADARGQNSQRSELNSLMPSRNNRTSNGADDNSESSESTSGCSSLIPQTNRQEAPANAAYNANLASRKRMMDEKLSFTNHLQSPRCLFLESGSRESLSSRRPSFNASMMTNTIERASSLSSPFYTGNVTFGGANALSHYKPSRSLFGGSSEFQLKVPRRTSVQVKPSSSECVDSSGMSQTAKRILEAMEYFSSPITDAKKIPVRNNNSATAAGSPASGRKRLRDEETQGATARVGLRHLTRELSVPTVPEMLKLRRRQKLQDTTMAARKIVSAMSGATSTSGIRGNSAAAAAASTASNDAAEYHLRTEQDENPKFHGKLRAKLKKSADDEAPAPSVNLPRISLPITSLPSFEPLPKYAKPPSAANSSRESPIVASSGSNSRETFKFASPIKISEAAWNLKSINNFSFSKPLDAADRKDLNNESREFSSSIGRSSSVSKTLSVDSASSSMFGGLDNGAANFMWPGASTAPRLKVKTRPKEQQQRETAIKEPFELKTGSVMDILGAKSPAAGDSSAQGRTTTSFPNFGTKSPTEIWECVDCYIKNDASEKTCVACRAARPAKKISTAAASSSPMSGNVATTTTRNDGFGAQFKMTSSQWECQSCLVRNQQTEIRCVSCSTPKPAEKAATPATTTISSSSAAATNAAKSSLMEKFKPAEGSWECPGCMLRNPGAVITCPCCKAAKPSTLKISPAKPTMKDEKKTQETKSLGLMEKFKPATSSWECSSCLVRNNETATSCVCCTSPKPGDSKATSAKPAETKISSNWGDKFKKPEGCWSCDSCLVQNKAETTECVACGGLKPGASAKSAPAKPASSQFSFGIPAGSSGFSFGVDKANEKPKDVNSAASNGFSFGAKPAGSGDSEAGKFTFGIPKSSDNSGKTSAENSAPKAAAGFVFAAPKTADDGGGGFKFEAGVKRSATDLAEDVKKDEKKAAATFSFGLPKTVEETTKGTENRSIFGGPPAAAAANGKPPQFVFGVPKSEAAAPEAGKSAPKMTFGVAAASNDGGSTEKSTGFTGETSQTKETTDLAFNTKSEQQQQKQSTLFSSSANASNLPAQNRAPFAFSEPKNKIGSEASSVSCFGQNSAANPPAANSAVATVSPFGVAPSAASSSSSSSGVVAASSSQAESQTAEAKPPAPSTNSSVFGSVEKKPSFFEMASGGEQKPSAFGAPEKKSTPTFGAVVENKLAGAFGNSAEKPANSGGATMFNSPSPAFGAPVASAAAQSLFGNNAAAPSPVFGSGATPSFGSSGASGAAPETTGIFAAAKTNAAPAATNPGIFTFGAPSASAQQTAVAASPATPAFSFTSGNAANAANAAKSLFAFGGAASGAGQPGEGFGAPAANNVAGGFGGGAAAANPAASPFTFNPPPKQEPPPSFGQATATIPSMFGAQPTAPSIGQPQPTQTASGGFNFGAAAPAPGAGVFSFGGGMSQPAAAPSTGGFNFNAPSPSPAIAFDPNSRPSFNFTGGTAPTVFNATPQPATTTRKIKKAVRRMPQR